MKDYKVTVDIMEAKLEYIIEATDDNEADSIAEGIRATMHTEMIKILDKYTKGHRSAQYTAMTIDDSNPKIDRRKKLLKHKNPSDV